MLYEIIENAVLQGVPACLLAQAEFCNMCARADSARYIADKAELILSYESKAEVFDLTLKPVDSENVRAILSRRVDTVVMADMVLPQHLIDVCDCLALAGYLTESFLGARLTCPQFYPRLYAAIAGLLSRLVYRKISLRTLETVAILDSAIEDLTEIPITNTDTCILNINLPTRQIRLKIDADGLITVDNGPFLYDYQRALQALAGMGVRIILELDSLTASVDQPSSERCTSYFSAPTPTPAPAPAPAPANPQGKTYNIRIAVTYTRDIMIQAATTQDLAARALTYTRGLPEELSDGFKQSNATIKRLS